MPCGNAGVLTKMSKTKFISGFMTLCLLNIIIPTEALSQVSGLTFGDFKIGESAETAKSKVHKQCEDWDNSYRTITGINCNQANTIEISFTKPLFRSEVVSGIRYKHNVKMVGNAYLVKLIQKFKNDPLLQETDHPFQGCRDSAVIVGSDMNTLALKYSEAKVCSLYLEYRMDTSQTVTLVSSVIEDAPDVFEIIIRQE